MAVSQGIYTRTLHLLKFVREYLGPIPILSVIFVEVFWLIEFWFFAKVYKIQ